MSLLNPHIVELLTEDQFTTVDVYFMTEAEQRQYTPQAPPTARSSQPMPAAPWSAPTMQPSFGFIEQDMPAYVRTYKVSKALAADLKKGDIVVVPTAQSSRKAKLATVWSVSEKALINYDAPFDYKWIIAKVDVSDYEAHIAREVEFKAHLEENEKQKQRKAARDAMLAAVRPTDDAGLQAFQGALMLLGVDPSKFEAPKAAE